MRSPGATPSLAPADSKLARTAKAASSSLSEDGPHFSEIGRRSGAIDAALLPIGAYDPPWFMSKQHLNPEEAVQAFEDLSARSFVAMHWGTFQLTDEALDEPPARLASEWARRGLDRAHCHVLPVGGSLEVRSGAPARALEQGSQA